MKTSFLIVFAIGVSGLLVPYAFGVTEELIHGSSSIELLPAEIIPGKPTSFEIKFQYTEGPYALENLVPTIETSPASARPHIKIDVKPTSVTNGQIVRIPVTLTAEPQIEHEKVFLSISFAGDHFSSRSDAVYKSAWSESVILDIAQKDPTSAGLLPSSEDYEFKTLSGARCDDIPSICYGTFTNGTSIQIQCDYRHSCGITSFDDSVEPYPNQNYSPELDSFIEDGFQIYQITKKQIKYNVPYKITNDSNTVNDMQLNCDDTVLVLSISSSESGALEMDLPDAMLENIFMVLADGKELTSSNLSITEDILTMSFPENTNKIEIFGVHYLSSEKNTGVCDIVHDPPYSYILPPLKQITSTRDTDEKIICKDNLTIIKKYDETPACFTIFLE